VILGRSRLRLALALLYLVAGTFHLARPAPFLRITPGWVPYPGQVIAATGLAELLGAITLVQPFSPGLRRAAGASLALYALCVWPANINHFVLDMAKADHGWGLGYHVPRLIAQPLLIWLALWTGGVTDWPSRRPG
jgi:uncharacterized membrane protein